MQIVFVFATIYFLVVCIEFSQHLERVRFTASSNSSNKQFQ